MSVELPDVSGDRFEQIDATHAGPAQIVDPGVDDWWRQPGFQPIVTQFALLGRLRVNRTHTGGSACEWHSLAPFHHGQERLKLPSGGDCSYPGLVWHEGVLWVSYYSSHEGRTMIYLARVQLP